jgi:hypothetical protein
MVVTGGDRLGKRLLVHRMCQADSELLCCCWCFKLLRMRARVTSKMIVQGGVCTGPYKGTANEDDDEFLLF